MHAEAKSVFRKHQRNFFFKSLILAFKYASKILPRWFMRFTAIFFSLIFICFNVANYRSVRVNMRIIFPDKGSFYTSFLAFRTFLKYAWYLIDLFYLSHGKDRIKSFRINTVGEENMNEAIGSGHGIILLTLHMGNWEIGGIKLAKTGITPTIVYFPDSQDIIESQRNRFRSICNIRHVELGAGRFSSIKLLRILQEGGAVAIQGDRLQYDRGIEMEMFGHKARFPKGPIMLASAADAVILPAFVIIEGYNIYNIYIEKPISIKVYSNRAETLGRNLSDIIPIFEKYIRKYPDQWYTFMPFWLKDKKETGNET